jgi:hypothetical protein
LAFPEPEPGLVVSYAYLWHREAVAGLDDRLDLLVGKIGRREAAAAGLVPAKRLVFVGRDEIAHRHGHLDALLDEE